MPRKNHIICLQSDTIYVLLNESKMAKNLANDFNVAAGMDEMSAVYNAIMADNRHTIPVTQGGLLLGKGSFKRVFLWNQRVFIVERVRGDTPREVWANMHKKLNRISVFIEFAKEAPCNVIFLPCMPTMVRDKGLYLVCYSKRCVSDDLFMIMNQAIRHYHTDDKYLRVVDAAVKNIVHGIMDFLLVATYNKFYFADIKLENMLLCPCQGTGPQWVLADLDDAVNRYDFKKHNMVRSDFFMPMTYIYNSQICSTQRDFERITFFGVMSMLYVLHSALFKFYDTPTARFLKAIFRPPDKVCAIGRRFIHRMHVDGEGKSDLRRLSGADSNIFVKPLELRNELQKVWKDHSDFRWDLVLERVGDSLQDIFNTQYKYLQQNEITREEFDDYLISNGIEPYYFNELYVKIMSKPDVLTG